MCTLYAELLFISINFLIFRCEKQLFQTKQYSDTIWLRWWVSKVIFGLDKCIFLIKYLLETGEVQNKLILIYNIIQKHSWFILRSLYRTLIRVYFKQRCMYTVFSREKSPRNPKNPGPVTFCPRTLKFFDFFSFYFQVFPLCFIPVTF